MHKLLINSLVREFYQQHAGFFLFGMYVLFGVVEPRNVLEFNAALLLSGLTSLPGMLVVFTLWFLYSLKVWVFITGRLKLPRYNFVRETASLKTVSQLMLWLRIYSVILLPVLVYVVLLIIISLKHQFYFSFLGVITVFCTLIFMLAWLSFRHLSFGSLRQEPVSPVLYKSAKPYFSWPLYHLFDEHLVMLLICKLLSFTIFKGIMWMFADVAEDIRTLLIALLGSVICHAVLVYNLLGFEVRCLGFTRSLPLTVTARFMNWLSIFAIIFLPEWVFFIMGAEYGALRIFNGVLFGISCLFFLLILVYYFKLNMGSYLKALLVFFFITMWAILAHVYLIFSWLLLGCSWLFYRWQFEKTDLRGE